MTDRLTKTSLQEVTVWSIVTIFHWQQGCVCERDCAVFSVSALCFCAFRYFLFRESHHSTTDDLFCFFYLKTHLTPYLYFFYPCSCLIEFNITTKDLKDEMRHVELCVISDELNNEVTAAAWNNTGIHLSWRIWIAQYNPLFEAFISYNIWQCGMKPWWCLYVSCRPHWHASTVLLNAFNILH